MDALSKSFQEFFQTIYNWPQATIEKTELIKLLEKFHRTNPQLSISHNQLSPSLRLHQPQSHDDMVYYTSAPTEKYSDCTFTSDANNSDSVASYQSRSIDSDSSIKTLTSSNNKIVFADDLTFRKGSKMLSSLIRECSGESTIYGELSYEENKNEKIAYFTLYNGRERRTKLSSFKLDTRCLFSYETERDFQFKHETEIEYFTARTGLANRWLSAFSEIRSQDPHEDDVYENPDALFSSASTEQSKNHPKFPERPPPRPQQSISPKNIYVCLYDHRSKSREPYELEFKCGDLLYVLNKEGKNFYIARLLKSLSNIHEQTTIGYVYKEYVAPAYEKN